MWCSEIVFHVVSSAWILRDVSSMESGGAEAKLIVVIWVCRYYDASIGFLTCHFASDSKGKSRIAKRNADAFNTLR